MRAAKDPHVHRCPMQLVTYDQTLALKLQYYPVWICIHPRVMVQLREWGLLLHSPVTQKLCVTLTS